MQNTSPLLNYSLVLYIEESHSTDFWTVTSSSQKDALYQQELLVSPVLCLEGQFPQLYQ